MRVPDSSPLVTALTQLADLPDVAAASERAREVCTNLRWHEALRRRIPEASAESRVRGAWASAELDGARSTATIVRDLMRAGWVSAWMTINNDPDIIHGDPAAAFNTAFDAMKEMP